ncbi:MAG: WbqC family protein [Nitrospinales bacterium]
MKLAIVQPYLFPYIGYFQLINAVDKFVVYDDVHFMKKRWINRNNILIGGKPSFFTVPLKKVSQNKLIKDVEIVDGSKWRPKILRSVELAYKRAPCFQQAYSLVEEVLLRDETHISKLAAASLKAVSRFLDIDTKFVDSSTFYKNPDLKSQERILDICKQEAADWYFNPVGGTELYSREKFSEENIRLNFIKTLPIEYKQYKNDFVPSLSIIDALMFNPKETVREFLNQYELI